MIPREITGKTRGQNGVASPFPWGSPIPYNVPVYPGALCHQVFRRYYSPAYRQVREHRFRGSTYRVVLIKGV